MDKLYALLQAIGEHRKDDVRELVGLIMAEKSLEMLDHAQEIVGATMFASTEGEVIDEGNAENKAKKNSHEDSIGRTMIKKVDAKGGEVSTASRHNPRRFTRIGRSLGYTDKQMKESAETLDEGEVKKANKAKKNVHMITSGKRKIDPKRAILSVKESSQHLDEGNAENKAKKNAAIMANSYGASNKTLARSVNRQMQGKENADLMKNRKTALMKKIQQKLRKEETDLQERNYENSKKKSNYERSFKGLSVEKKFGRTVKRDSQNPDPLATKASMRQRDPAGDKKISAKYSLSLLKRQRKLPLPESADLQEKITKKTPTDKVVSDFVHSKDPRFKGKSKKERIRMALGAKYAKMKEEAEATE